MTAARTGSKSVHEGVLQHVSASQIVTFVRCPRRWYGMKVEGIQEDYGVGAAWGVDIHNEVEEFYKNGVSPLSVYGRTVLDYWPLRGPCIESEPSIHNVLAIAGVKVRGFIDLFDFRNPDTIVIRDLKTKSNLDYGLDEDELSRDPQMIIYAQYARLRFPLAKRFELRHLNVQVDRSIPMLEATKRPAVVEVAATVTPDDIDEVLPSLEAAVEEMKATARSTFEATRKNHGDCWSYRKACPLLARCHPTAVDRFAAQMDYQTQGESMSLMKKLQTESTSSSPNPNAEAAQMRALEKIAVNSGILPPDAPVIERRSSTPAPEAGTTTSTGPAGELYLYIDCMPLKIAVEAPMQFLEDLIAERAAPIAKKHNVSDVREVKFGEGTAALCSSFLASPPSGWVLATTGGLSTQVIEVLTPLATVVVRGSR